jgi:hypothetical protein
LSLTLVGSSLGNYSQLIAAAGNQVITYCWAKPTAPNLLSPADLTYTSQADISFSWDSSTSSCSLASLGYNFQIYSDSALSNLVLESAYTPALTYLYSTIPEGHYWWRVVVRDQFANHSESLVYSVVVDRTAPAIPSLSITGSFTKSVEEKINPSSWTVAGHVSTLASDTISDPSTTITSLTGTMFKVGDDSDPGNYVWDNRLMRSFSSGAKSLSLHYNFFSRDYSPFDQPGFFIRLNGQEVFRLNTLESDGSTALTTGWQEFYYDLSSQENSQTNLIVYAGNTTDQNTQSWVYVDSITTYFVSAPLHAVYTLTGSDNSFGSGLSHYTYRVDSGPWQFVSLGTGFTLNDTGSHILQYHSTDNAGNTSPVATVRIIIDNQAPSDITDLSVVSTDSAQIALAWTAPGNDGTSGRAASYDLRYSQSPITDGNFANANRVILPSPQTWGSSESFILTSLTPSTTYYFALKSADEAPNWSGISNVVFAATTSGNIINPGDIVINEIIWIGGANPEQLIELRNTTERDLTDLSGLTLRLNSSILVDFAGSTLPAHAYFLISTLNSASTNLLPSGIIDRANVIMDLSRISLDLNLDYFGTTIDTAWNPASPVTEGVVDATPGAQKYYSMERLSSPGAGDDPLNWYTCIDLASSVDFFQTISGVDIRATPRAANRSENEPFARLSFPTTMPTIIVPTGTPTPTPVQLSVSLSPLNPQNSITLSITNVTVSFNYEIKYTNSVGDQGFAGEILLGDLHDNQVTRQLFLGTCSSGGTCTPDSGIGSTAAVILSGDNISFSQTFALR